MYRYMSVEENVLIKLGKLWILETSLSVFLAVLFLPHQGVTCLHPPPTTPPLVVWKNHRPSRRETSEEFADAVKVTKERDRGTCKKHTRWVPYTSHTVDGSVIPNNHLAMYKTL